MRCSKPTAHPAILPNLLPAAVLGHTSGCSCQISTSPVFHMCLWMCLPGNGAGERGFTPESLPAQLPAPVPVNPRFSLDWQLQQPGPAHQEPGRLLTPGSLTRSRELRILSGGEEGRRHGSLSHLGLNLTTIPSLLTAEV